MKYVSRFSLPLALCLVANSGWAAGFQPRSARTSGGASADDASASMYQDDINVDEPVEEPKAAPKKSNKRSKRKKRKPRRKQRQPEIRQEKKQPPPQRGGESLPSPDEVEDGYPKTGLGLGIGYESRYGNGLSFHFLPNYFLDVNAGVGMNRSGLKGGLGADFILNFARGFGMSIGESYVYSLGRESQVQLAASFTPEGGGASKELYPQKDYKVSPAQIASTTIGFFMLATPRFKLGLNGHYNYVFAGNKVEFKDGIRYGERVDVTNEAEFDEEFRKRAEQEVAAGGAGASLGLTVFF